MRLLLQWWSLSYAGFSLDYVYPDAIKVLIKHIVLFDCSCAPCITQNINYICLNNIFGSRRILYLWDKLSFIYKYAAVFKYCCFLNRCVSFYPHLEYIFPLSPGSQPLNLFCGVKFVPWLCSSTDHSGMHPSDLQR